MITVGRLCVKIAGRDAGKKCVVIDVLDKNFVLLDGQVRRKKCNIKHIEPLEKEIKIEKNADHTVVVAAFKKLGLEVTDTKPKAKQTRPNKARKTKKVSQKSVGKKPAKKEIKEAKKEESSKEKKPAPAK